MNYYNSTMLHLHLLFDVSHVRGFLTGQNDKALMSNELFIIFLIVTLLLY